MSNRVPVFSCACPNIATFALGRREAQRGAVAVSLVRIDGEVSAAILEPIRAIPAITEAKLLHQLESNRKS